MTLEDNRNLEHLSGIHEPILAKAPEMVGVPPEADR